MKQWLKKFIRETTDEVVWTVWLYFHPFAAFRLTLDSEEYNQQRADVLRRFRASAA